MAEIEVFLDETPGETRGMIARDARFEHLLIERESDPACYRLDARSVGRVVEVEAGLRAAFVDLGGPAPMAFLPLRKGDAVTTGQKVEVTVVAEPRENKGATVRRLGVAEGEPRLLQAGPSVQARLATLAPGVEVQTGAAAMQASWDAQEEALAQGDVFAGTGLDLAVERTRAMIAVDIDYVGVPGRDGRKGRAEANREGLRQAARLIRLKRWGGLVAIDLIGAAHDPQTTGAAVKAAFGSDPEIVLGPINRFGVVQLALPWRFRPIEDVLYGPDGVRRTETMALDLVRRVRHAMLSDTAVARFEARCAAVEVAIAGPLLARLAPRVRLIADASVPPGRGEIREA